MKKNGKLKIDFSHRKQNKQQRQNIIVRIISTFLLKTNTISDEKLSTRTYTGDSEENVSSILCSNFSTNCWSSQTNVRFHSLNI